MAAGGGHWVKSTEGPYAGSFSFVPATKSGLLTDYGGQDYNTLEQGGLVAVSYEGQWHIYAKGTAGNELGEYYDTTTSGELATNKMMNMNAQGYAKGKAEDLGQDIANLSGTTLSPQVAQAFTPGVKGTPGVKKVPIVEPGAKNISPEGAGAAAQAAAISGKGGAGATITAEDFAQMASPVTVQTSGGKSITKQGIDLGNGYFLTQSSTGKFYVVDKATNKTISSAYENIGDAHEFAKSHTPYFDPPPGLSDSYVVFKDQYAAEKAIIGDLGHYYQSHSAANGYATPGVKKALTDYQDGEYGHINDHLWKGYEASSSTLTKIKNLDKAFSKAETPYDMVAVRSKGSGSSLYKLAKGMQVGDTYIAKGFDSSGLHFNNNFGGGSVRLIYRVPKGTPALVVNGVHGNFKAYSSENELLFSRNLKWNVIGKSSSGGNIEIHLEYAGRLTQ